jgi:hypothetical protein
MTLRSRVSEGRDAGMKDCASAALRTDAAGAIVPDANPHMFADPAGEKEWE